MHPDVGGRPDFAVKGSRTTRGSPVTIGMERGIRAAGDESGPLVPDTLTLVRNGKHVEVDASVLSGLS